ncbi:MAG: AAA family ATPase [Hyphomicrobiales bacterium]|nr:AAA family ATPase [Hyphomicrobiales bacterium]
MDYNLFLGELGVKVGISGSHSTGKSTLCNELLGMRATYKICPEVPRDIVEYLQDPTFFRAGSNSLVRQILLLFCQCVAESAAKPSEGLIITDRTLVDHIAYSILLFPDLTHTPEYKVIKRAVATHLPSYSLIFKVPIEFQIQEDGVRELNKNFQMTVDHVINQLYREFYTPVIEIAGSLTRRAKLVDEIIQQASLQGDPI